MEARYSKAALLAAAGRTALLAAVLLVAMGARQRTDNFIIETPDPNFAQQLAQAAEKFRHDLAIEWLGKPMPNWAQPCVIEVQVGQHLGAGGATTFVFDHGEVFNWRMSIQGSSERLLDSVLPHEITHMIFASHFRQPLPRWADEGGATSVEHAAERNKYRQMLTQFLRTGHGIAFSQMFAMTDYPSDMMPLYAQGYSLAEYLIQTGGRRKYVEFLGEGLKDDDWPGALQRHYGVKDLSTLQNTWLAWVKQGSPSLAPRDAKPTTPPTDMLAVNQRRPRPEPNLIYHIRDEQSSACAAGAPGSGPHPVDSQLASCSGRRAGSEGHSQQCAGPTDRHGHQLDRSNASRFAADRANRDGRSARQTDRAAGLWLARSRRTRRNGNRRAVDAAQRRSVPHPSHPSPADGATAANDVAIRHLVLTLRGCEFCRVRETHHKL